METRRRSSKPADLTSLLRRSWYHLRLSVRHPTRVPTWDAIVLTAASPDQAQLYHWQLRRAKRLGRIAESTVTLAVPDPDGARIGSGAATLHALRCLAEHLLDVQVRNSQESNPHSVVREGSNNELTPSSMVILLEKKHVLLLHAGGDSKRVPWANPMGKVFLPLPYLASDNPDGPVPLLFDHILAISSCARKAFRNEGGIFIMTGDVLPCFDASTIILPDDAACIITVPITLDIASNHGVIITSRKESFDTCSLDMVENLLQKPNLADLMENNAIRHDGRALLDTGIIAVRGGAWVELVKLSSMSDVMISELLETRKEMSLYEDLVAAWVSAKHDWLKERPLGKALVDGLGNHKMFSYCFDDLQFLHFGTSNEVLDHLSDTDSSLVGRRHLCFIPQTIGCDIAASAVILSSKISEGVSIGDDSLVYDSSLSGRMQIGSQSIVVGVNILEGDISFTGNNVGFILPDQRCLWEVPLFGSTKRVVIYCGIHDNPKIPFSKNGTFSGRPWKMVLHDLHIQEEDLWNPTETKQRCLWNAKLFPILTSSEMLSLSMWLMGSTKPKCHPDMLHKWRSSDRISLDELHRSIDFSRLCVGSSYHQAELAAGIAKACIIHGSLSHDLSLLCDEILQKETTGIEICKDFLALCPSPESQEPTVLPQSRAYQVQVDLLRACGDDAAAHSAEQKVWAAVAVETASAVDYGLKGDFSTSNRTTTAYQQNILNGHNIAIFQLRRVRIDLPVRVDFVGGWSDTPPWSLERPGCVLNMAIYMEESLPISVVIETTETTGILIYDDTGNQLFIANAQSITSPFENDDPFRLVKSALLVTGATKDKIVLQTGLCIRTSANVPRGSGLGTSSILAAAVVKGLLRLMGQDDGNENVARVVLVLEQVMGTGGGWQDQIGGLYPGIKCASSFPGQPLKIQVVPLLPSARLVHELEQRLLVVFTGQVRLAHQVLEKVVTRYLRRDNLLISSIKRLATLAKVGREAMMNEDIDHLGEIMLQAWSLHQELDPYCSNEFVDRLFAFSDRFCCGYKLVGAGGGGFALLLTKSRDCALELTRLLKESPEFDVKVYNWNIHLE